MTTTAPTQTTSRIGRLPIQVPGNVVIEVAEDLMVTIKGPKATLKQPLPALITLKQENNVLNVVADYNQPQAKALHGTTRALLANHIRGVTEGHRIKLKLVGVGYRAQSGTKGSRSMLTMTLGKSHPDEYVAPEGVLLEAPSQTEVVVSGANKEHVGQVAAELRALRKPDAYKGKGVQYDGEVMSLKEVKKK